MKVLVIGLDGVSLNVLDAVGWEKLPHLKRLLKSGTSATLRSVLPPMTAQAWATFATGKNPGGHGAYNFFLPDTDLNHTKIVSSDDIAGSTFYELLEQAGKHCVLINMPVSHPIRLTEGITISSFLSSNQDWYFPSDLPSRVSGLDNYRLFPDTFLEFGAPRERYAQEISDMARSRFHIASQLFTTQPWDFFFLLFSETDWLQHRTLSDLEAGKIDSNSYVYQLYQQLDDYLGWFLDHLPKNTTFFLMSDHGFRVYQGRFYINQWLKDQGYLNLTTSPGDQTQPQVVARNKISQGGQAGVLSWIFKMGGLAALNFPPLRTATAKTFHLVSRAFPQQLQRDLTDFSDINTGCDLSSSQAYSMPGNFGAIYLNTKARFPSGIIEQRAYPKIVNRIIQDLQKLRDPVTHLPAVKHVFSKQKIYSGSQLDMAPDIICSPGDFWIKPSVSVNQTFWHGPVASHAVEGIFAVYNGKTARHNLPTVNIADLAPTVLKLMDVKVPKDMDGKAIKID